MYLDEAIFIADVHYNKEREEFLYFLDKLDNENIKSKTLFLCGDIFDFLSESVDFSVEYNTKLIQKLNHLSKKLHIVYLEGNHDFNLKRLFENIDIITRDKQPLVIHIGEKIGLVSHGDLKICWKYEIFTKILRNGYFLSLICKIDKTLFNKKIVEYLFWYLLKKRICFKNSNFESFIKQRVDKFRDKFKFDFIIEGHFHQGIYKKIDKDTEYLNIPSFACEKSFFIIKSKKNGFLLSKVSARSFDVSQER